MGKQPGTQNVDVLEKHWGILTGSLVDGKLDEKRFEVIAEMYKLDQKKLLDAAIKKLNMSSSIPSDQSDSEEMYRKAEYDAILSGMGGATRISM
jgi:hypothetical protein